MSSQCRYVCRSGIVKFICIECFIEQSVLYNAAVTVALVCSDIDNEEATISIGNGHQHDRKMTLVMVVVKKNETRIWWILDPNGLAINGTKTGRKILEQFVSTALEMVLAFLCVATFSI